MIGDLIDNMRRGGTETQEALENGEVIEEEVRGEIKAVSILLDPDVAAAVWENVKNEPTCSPIIISKGQV